MNENKTESYTALTPEEINALESFVRYFGRPDKNGHIFISTEKKNIPSVLPYGRARVIDPMNDTAETILATARQANLFLGFHDRREPDSAGDSGDVVIPGDPDGGVDIILSDDAKKYLDSSK
jgi:hypothetical protein